MSCLSRSSQRRTARFPESEVRIHYPFHPRAGQMVQVVARSSHGGVAELTIVQCDGTLAKVPAWMTEERAREAVVVRDPALPVAALLEVRAMLDRSLSLLGGESSPDSGGENESDQSSSTASVRCHPRSRINPVGSPKASADAYGDAPERSSARRGGWGRSGFSEGDNR